MNHSPNRLLASISNEIFEALRPNLKVLELKLGEVLAEVDAPIRDVFFPHSGIVSLVVPMTEGDMIETAMVGRDGVVNGASALDGRVSLNRAIVQSAGHCAVIPAAELAEVADRYREFRKLLIRHEQVLLAQAQQSAACNAAHAIGSRLCRWLLRMRDLIGKDDLFLTQEFLAQMLGVRRTSVSIIARSLQGAGLIRYKRGHVEILDVDGLRDSACECYGRVNIQYQRMLNSGLA